LQNGQSKTLKNTRVEFQQYTGADKRAGDGIEHPYQVVDIANSASSTQLLSRF